MFRGGGVFFRTRCSYNRPGVNSRQTSVVTISILGRDPHDQRDQPIIFDAVHVTLGCMSEIQCRLLC